MKERIEKMKEKRARKRAEAEERNAKYQALSLEQKVAKAGLKVLRKLGIPA